MKIKLTKSIKTKKFKDQLVIFLLEESCKYLLAARSFEMTNKHTARMTNSRIWSFASVAIPKVVHVQLYILWQSSHVKKNSEWIVDTTHMKSVVLKLCTQLIELITNINNITHVYSSRLTIFKTEIRQNIMHVCMCVCVYHRCIQIDVLKTVHNIKLTIVKMFFLSTKCTYRNYRLSGMLTLFANIHENIKL